LQRVFQTGTAGGASEAPEDLVDLILGHTRDQINAHTNEFIPVSGRSLQSLLIVHREELPFLRGSGRLCINAEELPDLLLQSPLLAGVFVPSLRGPKGQQVLVLAAWSMVHGLTTLAIDGAVAGPGPVIHDYAEKVARTFCRGIVRK